MDDSLACWGSDEDGRASPPDGTFSQLSAGYSHTCAVRTDGTLACWGYNEHRKADPPSGSFSQVAAGAHRTCAIDSTGSITCWGLAPPLPPEGRFLQVSAQPKHLHDHRDDSEAQHAEAPGSSARQVDDTSGA